MGCEVSRTILCSAKESMRRMLSRPVGATDRPKFDLQARRDASPEARRHASTQRCWNEMAENFLARAQRNCARCRTNQVAYNSRCAWWWEHARGG